MLEVRLEITISTESARTVSQVSDTMGPGRPPHTANVIVKFQTTFFVEVQRLLTEN